MSSKPMIDLSRSLYDLTVQFPELVELLASLGFEKVRNPALRVSVGRMMTLPKGAEFMGLDFGAVLAGLEAAGYEVVGGPAASQKEATTVERLKGLLARLNAGEDFEVLKAEFERQFGSVSAGEIMQAEQEMMAEGTPREEVQKLCDLHGALFIRPADDDGCSACGGCGPDYAGLDQLPGHPLRAFLAENRGLAALIRKAKDDEEALAELKPLLSAHYRKKGDLLFPLLEVSHGVSGPSRVMWAVDGEIRRELNALLTAGSRDEAWRQRRSALLERAQSMIGRENEILLPLCAEKFTFSEWMDLYHDAKDYGPCGAETAERWPLAEARGRRGADLQFSDEVIRLPGGQMTLEQLRALLDTMPFEITLVDADDVNRFFNDNGEPKAFKRPLTALGRDVFTCHPPQVQARVHAIIDDFKAGRRDAVSVWMPKDDGLYYVQYLALRSPDGTYLGTMELVQNMAYAQTYFERKNRR